MGGHRRVKRTFHKGQVLELTITDMAFGGKGIARVETEKGPFVVFVQNAFPGQTVNAQVVKCKSKHAECRLLNVLERAPFEVDLPYQPIPGAPYATVPLERQHEWKAKTALDLYKKIGEVHDVEDIYEGFVPSPLTWHYRNKMEYSFSEIRHDLETDEKVDDFGLGFKHRGTWWAVENLDADSGLFDPLVESTLREVRAWCEGTRLPAWHPPKREGFFRFLVVRKSYANDGLLVNLVTTSDAPLDEEGFVACIRGLWGDRVEGILHTVNDDKGERVEAREGKPRVIWGESTVTEVLHGLSFAISMGSFFQTNPRSAERLYAEVLALALEGAESRLTKSSWTCSAEQARLGNSWPSAPRHRLSGWTSWLKPFKMRVTRRERTTCQTSNLWPRMRENSCLSTLSTRAKFTRSSSTLPALAFPPKPCARSCDWVQSVWSTSAAIPQHKPATWWCSKAMATPSITETGGSIPPHIPR